MTDWRKALRTTIRRLVRAKRALDRTASAEDKITREMLLKLQALGYYSPIPDRTMLKDDLWLKRSELVGIDINEKKQLELLNLFASKFKGEYDAFPSQRTSIRQQYYVRNGSFESVDGEVLYCMIRHFRPGRIIEIGSGYSTYLSAQAVLRNMRDGFESELLAVDPFPNQIVRAGFPGLSKLVTQRVQDLPVHEFSKLKEDDILFIDSTHVLAIGSDVQHEYLEIIPRLNKGVIVHVHDIFLPAEYPEEWVLEDYKFWSEQYLLQAFLSFNDSFEVLWASSYMHLTHPDGLEWAFSSYRRNLWKPASFWMRRVK